MLSCGRYNLTLERPLVMGIVNLTPDSFSGDGVGTDTARAVAHAHRQIEAGADLLDLGAESSRPGATPASLDEELDRLLPVLEALAGCPVPISVDTYKPEVMRAAVDHGASMINDIYGFRWPGAIEAVAASNCALCLMHMQGEPLTMQAAPHYDDVVGEVNRFLGERVAILVDAGVARERIVLDPGFGFGKTLDQNYELLAHLDEFADFRLPLLVGMSRKSMVGQLLDRPVEARLAGSLALALYAATRGAHIIRVHDVQETVDALRIFSYADQFRTQR